MQQVIIDCQTKKTITVELSQVEIEVNEEARRVGVQRELIEQRKVNKKLLVSKFAELREMKQNRDVFSDEDIAELQAEIDTLKGKLGK